MTYYYTGVTAFFEDNDETNTRMRALAEAIPGLDTQLLKTGTESLDYLYNATSSRVFSTLQANQSIFTPYQDCFPVNTHPNKQEVNLGYTEIDGFQHIALYVPVVSKDKDLVYEVAENALRTVLLVLFGEHLIDIEAKSGTNEDRYDSLLMKYLYR